MSIYQRLNYQRGLTTQKPDSKFIVLYTSSATHIASCVVNSTESYTSKVSDSNFEVERFFVEHTTYHYDTDNIDEAYYLSSILNSKKLDDLIKPLQAKGQFGERHIHKIPLSFPIPQYKPDIEEHRELARIGLDCHEKVKKIISPLPITSVGTMRSKIREAFKSEFSLIDKNVEAILF